MTIYLLKGYLGYAAPSLATAKELIAALANRYTVANAAIIARITAQMERLVQSDSGEALTVSSIDDATGTISAWVTDAGISLAVGLGDVDPATATTYANTSSFTISGSTRLGTLALNTTELAAALTARFATQLAADPDTIPGTADFSLQIRTSTSGITETVGLLPVTVAAGILSSTPNPQAVATYVTSTDFATAIDALTGAATAANSTGDTTLTLATDQKILAAVITFTGSAGTRRVVLPDTNATAGIVAALNLILPATAGITVQLYSGSTAGTLLATVATDGTAGTVGLLCTRGASAWNEPTQAAWLD